jgi:NADH:ubiquinone oxidoreductase subunit E
MTDILDQIIARYHETDGNIISLLQDTQESFGHIPKDAVLYFAEQLNLPPSRFYGIATFYAQFRLTPVGKNRVTACCGTACHVRGAERILNSIRRELGLRGNEDTTSDGEITVEQVNCVGACSIAPVVIINNKIHAKSSPDRIMKELRALKRNGHADE